MNHLEHCIGCFGLFWPTITLLLTLILIFLGSYIIVLFYRDRQQCRQFRRRLNRPRS